MLASQEPYKSTKLEMSITEKFKKESEINEVEHSNVSSPLRKLQSSVLNLYKNKK